ncbi:MAG: serine/threonine protein kinase [Myxococcus sp.]|nr:serine/threonine protein kinase [Myxococcus sp.]
MATASKRFGKYELVRSLGHGGMAEAWLAHSKGAAGVTKPVVIKKVLPELAAQAELIEAFVAEATISTSLSHGNIAQVFEFGEVKGEYYLAMEWVNGKSLAHVLHRAAQKGYWHLPIPIAVYIAAETLKGLHHAHTRKGADGRPLHLVHRDATPDNILLSFEGEVKVADFGIAKARLSGRKETQIGVVKGKFLYFSPEQATGKQVDARADVYAVGAALYQMLTGQLAFEGPFMQVMPKLVAGAYRPVRELNPEVPEALEAIVDRAMAKDLAARYRTAQQMLEALTTFLSENAPSFSAERLKLLLDFLYEAEHEAEGEARLFSESERDQLATWKPAARKRSAASRAGPDVTAPALKAVADAPPPKSMRVAAIGVMGVLVVGAVAAAGVLLTSTPPSTATEPTAIVPVPPPSRPGRALPVEPKPAPAEPEPAPVAAVAVVTPADDGHRALKLLADTHLVSHRPARTQWKQLGEGTSWRVSLVEPGPLLANVQLEFEDAAGKQLVPIKNGETLQVRNKRSVGVLCEPGARVGAEQVAVLMLNAGGSTQRLRIDPMQCADYEQAKRIELDHEKHYTLAVPADVSATLGDEPRVRVAWRTRLKDGAFSAGDLKPGQSTNVDGAVFLELGFFDQTASDNQGSVELSLDVTEQPTRLSGGGTVERVGDEKGGPVLPYAASLKLAVVQRARALMQAGRVPEVLPTIAPCFKEPLPVPECYRLEGEAYVRLDQPDRALVSYRRFLDLAGPDHPGRHSVGEYVRASEP